MAQLPPWRRRFPRAFHQRTPRWCHSSTGWPNAPAKPETRQSRDAPRRAPFGRHAKKPWPVPFRLNSGVPHGSVVLVLSPRRAAQAVAGAFAATARAASSSTGAGGAPDADHCRGRFLPQPQAANAANLGLQGMRADPTGSPAWSAWLAVGRHSALPARGSAVDAGARTLRAQALSRLPDCRAVLLLGACLTSWPASWQQPSSPAWQRPWPLTGRLYAWPPWGPRRP